MAWSFHNSTGLEWDDLFQEAALAYFEALKMYDPARGQVTTFVWGWIEVRLKNYRNEELKHRATYGLEAAQNECTNPAPYWQALTKDAQEVAHVVLASPKAFVCLNRQEAEARVQNVFTNRGWPLKRINMALLNLMLALS